MMAMPMARPAGKKVCSCIMWSIGPLIFIAIESRVARIKARVAELTGGQRMGQ